MKMTRKELHRSARIFLQSEIDLLRPGEALPGIRTLCSRSKINLHILNSELQSMVQSGQIIAVPRRGMFKGEEEKKKAIWLFYEQNTQKLFTAFSLEVYEELHNICKIHDFSLKSCQLTKSFLPKCREFCRHHHIEKAFCKGFSHPWFMEMLQKECRHCIALLPGYTVSEGFALIDSPEMSAIQLEYLFNLGYRKIGYIHNVAQAVEKSFVQQRRLLEYYRIMAEYGLPVKPEWVFSGYCTAQVFADRLTLLIKSGAEAVIVPGSFLRKLYDILQNQLYVPGRDLGIFCCDEINHLPVPEPATVTNSPKAIIKSAWQLMQESVCGAPPRIEYSQLRIIAGQTLKPHSATAK